MMTRYKSAFFAIVALFLAVSVHAAPPPVCDAKNTVRADVVALDQAFYVNRLGSFQSGGQIFALRRDVVSTGASKELTYGHVMLRTDKRARPIVLRMNAGDCLEIKFQNLLGYVPQVYFQYPPVVPWAGSSQMTDADPSNPNNPVSKFGTGSSFDNSVIQTPTRWAGVHVMGMEPVAAFDQDGNPVEAISADGSFAGRNDITANIATDKRASGLVPPGARMTYLLHAPVQSEGSYLLYSTAANVGYEPSYGGQLMQGLFGSVTVQPKSAEYYRSQVTHQELWEATYSSTGQNLTATNKTVKIHGQTAKVMDWHVGSATHQVIVLDADGNPSASGKLYTTEGQPLINYAAVDSAGVPILSMTTKGADGSRTLIHSDLTAIITGPKAGKLPYSPYAEPQPTPNGHQPWREFAIHYHDDFLTTLAFPQQRTGALAGPLTAGRDFFAINYGIGGIGTEVLANRIGVGPMYQCATCMFEEFFLSSWTVGDPAMVVDIPANNGSTASTVPPGPKATKALYPDDPSNVYHSYVGDHVIFQILHGGTNITHVHHMHAQQWLHSPRNPNGAYRDSQMISPGASFTLNHVYNGSGNINKTIGDSIFHCHFYPHFAQGMWAMWRVHDMFEEGTRLGEDGKPAGAWPRALPDGEIAAGVPTVALVPLPTIGMPLMPARVHIIPVKVAGYPNPVGYMSEVAPDDKNKNPGYPFFVPGVAGQRAPHPPLDFAWEEDANGNPKMNGNKPVLLDGGLPRHVAIYDPKITSVTSRWNFTKTNHALTAFQVPEDGTDTEKVAMKFHEHRNVANQPFYPSFTPTGVASHFEVNGEPRAHGAPYANPNRDLYGHKQCDEEKVVAKVLDPKEGEQPCLIRYKAADIQIDAVFNKVGWHYPQTRLITLWGDVKSTIDDKRMPEPFFFRANSEQIIEYWHSNLVPEYYELDDFQVRTPTDVIGQHIHLVKFDVTSSDGAGNGYNYEDGTFGAETVREMIHAINQCPGDALTCGQCPAGLFNTLTVSGGVGMPAGGQSCLTPKAIPYFGNGPHDEWLGAQATIQRWAADPVLGVSNKTNTSKIVTIKPLGGDKDRHIDRTLRTVFTHDHFGPSTHQQAGLYAGLLIEPRKSFWIDGQTGTHYGSNNGRPIGADGKPPMDGGPTGWQANIVDRTFAENSYREFALEFADSQLAYTAQSRRSASPYLGENDTSYTGWADPAHAVNPVAGTAGANSPRPPFPALVTFQFNTGGWSLNYRNEPLTLRMFTGAPATPPGTGNDLAYSFASIPRSLASLNTQPAEGTPIAPGFNDFKYPAPFTGAGATDPYTPLLRAYDGDNVQVRTLVGAHMGPHFFNFHGVNWLFEPQEEDSGYRSAQGMGISEHYEMIFAMPKTKKATSDYLYEVTSDTTGRKYGNWGILRSYAKDQKDLVRLPNNKSGEGAHPAGCPSDAAKRKYTVHAMTAAAATGDPNGIYYNTRGQAGANPPGSQKLVDPNGLVYVDENDLSGGKLKNPLRLEPLILRAAAGECVQVTLKNDFPAAWTTAPLSSTSNPQFSGTFTITAASADVMQEWWLAMSGNFGQTSAFYIDTNQHGSANYNFKTQFNTAPGNTFGYQLPNSNQVTSITWNCASTLPSSFYAGCTTTIVNGAQTFNVANDPADKTKLVISTQQSPAFSTSNRAGLHASLLSYDVTHSDGMNVGTNPDETVAPGGTKTYEWYAGRYDRDENGKWMAQPAEYGAVNLNPADPLAQHPKGLIGALIVEPVGATWHTDQNSKASANVSYKVDGRARNFREFVAVIQDDVNGLQSTGVDQYGKQTLAAANGQWTRAFNYKMEPLQYRYVNSANAAFLANDPALAPSGIVRAMSDQLTLSDPETPVFAAGAGQAVRIRMLHPAGVNEQVLTLHGHQWEEEPYKPGTASRVIGHNPQSQHNGSRDSFGPNVSWDLVVGHQDASGHVIDGAGGAAKTKGDYPFRTFIGTDFLVGLWGILRVGDNGHDVVTVTYYPAPNTIAAGIKGTATANTSTGKLASKVEIFSGTSASGNAIATANIDPSTGQWSTTTTSAPPIFVRSAGATGGSVVLNSYIPTSGDPKSTSAAAATPSTANEVGNFRNEPKSAPAPPAPPKPQPQPQP
jgi:manganese oxidase